MRDYKTQAAKVAALIKAELKEKFPGTQFSLKSETYSGGNSVTVRFDAAKDGLKRSDIEPIVLKYQEGHFDGMTDSYVHTNRTTGPTARYIFIEIDTTELEKEIHQDVLEHFGISEEDFTSQRYVTKHNGYPAQLSHRYVSQKYL